MMHFLAPEALWLLLALPALAAAYLAILHRKRKLAQRYAALSFVRSGLDRRDRTWRYIPAGLLLAALAILILACARPATRITLPSKQDKIVLAIDVSLSMSADDIKPNRLSAAQAAARTFIMEQPSNTRIGVVSFATTASLVQQPTSNRDDILGAIDRLQLQNHTAIGTGILVSLKAIFPDLDVDLISETLHSAGLQNDPRPLFSRKAQNSNPEIADKPVPPGSYTSAAIVLLSDGQVTIGPDPIEAATLAAEHGVRIFTVGIGTPNGAIVTANGREIRVRLDEESLKKIANLTKGEYFYASTSADLTKIYQSLSSRLVVEKKDTEVTAFFALAGAIFTVLSGLFSMLWFNRIF
jgi:Ca-activated chloride channel homolog